MFKFLMSFICIMAISLSTVSAYSPQDNFVQQNMYEITGAYLGETVDELKQQNLLMKNYYDINYVPLKTVGIAGVIFKKETVANFADNRLCSLVITFDDKNTEKTKKLQAYFVNKLGQPTFIDQPSGTYYLTVAQGHISFLEKNLSREADIQSTINYIKYCHGYMEYSKGNADIQNIYYVGEKGKEFFEASMKTMIDSHKEMFKNDAELANSVKAYFADKPEYGETLKLFFD